MENVEVKEKKVNKKVVRLIIGVGLIVLSCATGVISGVQIAKLTKTPVDENKHIDEIISVLKEKWMSEVYYGTENVDEDLLIRQFVGALSSSEEKLLDPYTYLIKQEDPIMVPALGKLGITLTNFYNIPVITEVDVRGTGYNILQEGDIVVTLGKINPFNRYDYVSILDENINFSNIFNVGLGKPFQKQYIKVARFDETNKLNYHEFEIDLGKTLPTQHSYLIENDINDTVMVKLTDFTTDKDNKQGTSDQLEDILKANPSSNLVIDLRGNGGGDVSSAIDVCDLFLPKDQVVTTLEYKNGRKEDRKTNDNQVYDYDKIVILQDEGTASASEIMISCLSYHLKDKLTLVGCKSYGKGIGTTKVKVFDGAYTLQYTCVKWLAPDGSWIGMTIDSDSNVGIEPSDVNKIYTSDTLLLMDYYNYYMRNYNYNFYKQSVNQEAFIVDKVATENQIFFGLYNFMYNTSYRTDTYFDESCIQAIKDYQTLKGLDVTGSMNLDTLVCFTNQYYVEDKAYNDAFVERAREIIE